MTALTQTILDAITDAGLKPTKKQVSVLKKAIVALNLTSATNKKATGKKKTGAYSVFTGLLLNDQKFKDNVTATYQDGDTKISGMRMRVAGGLWKLNPTINKLISDQLDSGTDPKKISMPNEFNLDLDFINHFQENYQSVHDELSGTVDDKKLSGEISAHLVKTYSSNSTTLKKTPKKVSITTPKDKDNTPKDNTPKDNDSDSDSDDDDDE